MARRVELTATAAKQLGKLDKAQARRITAFLRDRLASLDDPRSVGKVLAGPKLIPIGATGWVTTASFAPLKTACSASWSWRSGTGATSIVEALARFENQ